MNAPLRRLIACDGSEPSGRAVAHVVGLAGRGLSIEVHILNVQPAVRGAAAALVSTRDLESYHRDEGMNVLAGSLRQIAAAGLTPHVHVSVGDPGEVIVAFAQRLQCDHIVMGTRGFGTVSDLLLGSVARYVVGHSASPVTVVR